MNNVIDEVLAGEPRYTIKDNGGTPCLYDKKRKQFFYNSGTGDFSYKTI